MPQRYVSEELTHFVGRMHSTDEARYALLLTILERGLLTSDPASPAARAGVEGVVGSSYTPGAPFCEPGNYSMDCVCFCDIPVPDLPLHMAKYSRFGLAFRKPFLVRKGANPVFYWAVDALAPGGQARGSYLDAEVANLHWLIDRLRSDYPSGSRANSDNIDGRIEQCFAFVNRFFLHYLKPFRSSLSEEHQDNYYMEREWRVAGNLAFGLGDVWRIIVPATFGARLRRDVPEYNGQVQFADELSASEMPSG